jgi:AcrR family transcriptional regulator
METSKLPRREREKLRRRQEVFDVALRLFSEKGYHNVSMHAIAKEAEFAIGTLYKFFRNKEDLFKALIMQLSDRFHRALTEVIEGDAQGIEKLRAYLRVKAELFRNNVAAIRLYFAETPGEHASR